MFYGRKQGSLHSSYDLGWGYGENVPSRESRDLESVVVFAHKSSHSLHPGPASEQSLPAGGPTALASAWCPLVLFLVMDRNVLEQWAWEPVRQRRPEVPEGASLRFTDVMHPRVEPTSECSSSVKRPAGGPGGPPAEARGPGSV